MAKPRIAVVVGSLRKESFNRKLAEALAKLGAAELDFHFLRIDDLPLYNQDLEREPNPAVQRLKQEIRDSHGVLFVTPEYNRSLPGVLKNAIDHASRPYGESAWAGKPAGICGISVGALGTGVAQLHLRSILGYLDMPTLGQPEVYVQVKDGLFAPDGSIGIEATRKFLEGFLARYTAWVKRFAG